MTIQGGPCGRGIDYVDIELRVFVCGTYNNVVEFVILCLPLCPGAELDTLYIV